MEPAPASGRPELLPILVFLTAGLAAPWLPLPAGVLLLGAGAAFLAFAGGLPSKEKGFAVATLGLAGAGLLTALILVAFPFVGRGPPKNLQDGFEEIWGDLDHQAAVAADRLEGLDRERPSGAHRVLGELVDEAGIPGLTLLLTDPDGEPVVWAGRGLLYEPRGVDLPPEGRGWWSGFTSATLVSVRPLAAERRSWRIVAGRSLPTESLPFPPPGKLSFEWAPVSGPSGVPATALPIRLEGDPWIAVRPNGVAPTRLTEIVLARRFAWLVAGLGFLLLAGARFRREGARVGWALLLLGAAGSLGWAASVSGLGLLVLLTGFFAVSLVGLAERRPPRIPAGIAGAAFAVALFAGSFALQHFGAVRDLGADLLGDPETVAYRLGLLAFALCPFLWTGIEITEDTEDDRRAPLLGLLGVALLVAGAMTLAWPPVAAGLGIAGYACVVARSRGRGWSRGAAAPIVVLLVAGLVAGVLWEAAYRLELRQRADEVWIPRLEEPSQEELESTWTELEELFRELDLLHLVPTGIDESVVPRDLAYALWRRSPLARRDALTAVVVRPSTGDPVTFSYGLPLGPEGNLEREPMRWEGMAVRSWQERLIAGRGRLTNAGLPWGTVEYWLLPLPGFDPGPAPVADLATGLLRGGPASNEVAEGLPSEIHFGIYDASGRRVWSPWRAAPARIAPTSVATPTTVPTLEGTALILRRPGEETSSVLFVVRPGPVDGLERVGILVFGAVGIAGLLLIVVPGPWPAPSLRLLRREAFSSYSTRLLVVYALLLLVPLGLLELLLFRTFEERLLEEQRTAGEAALSSAQQILGEFVLSLEPGFGIETALDDALLGWVSRVIHREINLYWGGSVNASSKRELFSAGLLPARIPGEIHDELVFGGEELAWRTTRAGDARYLELYAPLRIPGFGGEASRLVLSLPLLAQQEEAAAELAELRRRSILLALALGVLAVLVGTRLARTFTRPLEELVRGTDRIAAGADRLGMEPPRDRELAALVEAIEEMARRIARARDRLLQEKEVVERIVEHIEAGIVSLDAEGRVVMSNRLATGILGVAPGDRLRRTAASRDELEPVAEFLAGPSDQLRETTVQLELGGEDRDFRLVWVPVPGPGEPSALLVLEDATEVLRAQRLQAWAEMARIIAHEVKNPLTPIRLSTEHMREVYRRNPARFDEVFEVCTTNILRQVTELRQIASEFSTYSSIPVLSRERADLVETMRDLAEGYRAAPVAGVAVAFVPEVDVLDVEMDERLVRRAIRNLVENAVRACGGQGGGRVEIRVRREGDFAVVEVGDDGPGVSADLLSRIFEPYFSTDDRGTGLGLPIARRVVEEHDGTIVARSLPRGGLEVTIRIPLS